MREVAAKVFAVVFGIASFIAVLAVMLFAVSVFAQAVAGFVGGTQ